MNLTGSLWRDSNDHVFKIDSIEPDPDPPEPGVLQINGTMMYCPDWCQMPHHKDGEKYTTWALPDELESGEIFGWSRVA